MLSRNGLLGRFEPTPDLLAKVNSRCPKPGILIALHSPYAILETGLRICLPEKSEDSDPFAAEQSVLCSPSCRTNIAKNGHVSRILGERAADFFCA
jgi:hypothetical protein